MPLFSRLGALRSGAARAGRVRARPACSSSTGATRRRCCRSRRSRCMRWRMERARRRGRDVAPRRGGAARAARLPDPLAGRDRGARAAAGQRLRGRARQGLVVGLERRQERPRGAVLVRRHHDRLPQGLRARLRPARARLPRAVLDRPTPSEADAQRELVRIAARALGIAAERDLRDYFRLDLADARARVAELRESGELLPVQVEGLRGERYLWHEAQACRAGCTRGRCSRRSTRWSGSARALASCSASTTGSRSTPRPPSACTATTCCRSCSATGSSRESTSSTTAPPACCACSPPTSSRTRSKADVMPELRDELHLMADWLGAQRGRRMKRAVMDRAQRTRDITAQVVARSDRGPHALQRVGARSLGRSAF